MQRGQVHTGENGERQVYWTQYIRNKASHPLPPGFSFIEYVEDEATDMDSSAA
jgi:predicted secreted acid phosphatase